MWGTLKLSKPPWRWPRTPHVVRIFGTAASAPERPPTPICREGSVLGPGKDQMHLSGLAEKCLGRRGHGRCLVGSWGGSVSNEHLFLMVWRLKSEIKVPVCLGSGETTSFLCVLTRWEGMRSPGAPSRRV